MIDRYSELLDDEAAQEIAGIMARHDAEAASIVRRQVTELLDIIDQRIDRSCKRASALDASSGHYRIRDIFRLFRRPRKRALKQREVRGDEAAQGIDPDIEKIEVILNYRKPLFGFHRQTPTVSDTTDDIARDERA